jgi:MoxR-like ATPase/transcriptional regulator with XRE-family HTH domain
MTLERDKMALAGACARERQRLGLTHSELAQKAGIDRSVISRIEAGKSFPTRRTLLKIATVLGDNWWETPPTTYVIPQAQLGNHIKAQREQRYISISALRRQLGTYIYEARTKSDMTRDALHKKTGLTDMTLGALEGGGAVMLQEEFDVLTEALGHRWWGDLNIKALGLEPYPAPLKEEPVPAFEDVYDEVQTGQQTSLLTVVTPKPTNGNGNSSGLGWLEPLLTGATLTEMQAITTQFSSIENSARTMFEQITSSDKQIVQEAIRDMLSNEKDPDLPKLKAIITDSRMRHINTPLLMSAIMNRLPVWLYGEAGSGKTTAAGEAAKALELSFGFISVCPTSTQSHFLGYMDAVGNYNPTLFRKTYEHGGVFLIDEIDNGSPAILAVLNSALANGECAFPDKVVERHKDCVIIAAANTIGRGATAQYVGRNAIDAATLDRFVFIKWNIDEELEKAIVGLPWDKKTLDIDTGGIPNIEQWLWLVRLARNKCTEIGLQHIISPRASVYGAKLLSCGVGIDHLIEMLITKGLKPTDRDKLMKAIDPSEHFTKLSTGMLARKS